MDVCLLFLDRKTTDRYRETVNINVQRPAIILMNRDAAGSLLARPQSMEERELPNHWPKRATIDSIGTVFIDPYLALAVERENGFFALLSGSNEYFHRRSNRGQDSSSTALSMSTDEHRRGGPEEFEETAERFQTQRRTYVTQYNTK